MRPRLSQGLSQLGWNDVPEAVCAALSAFQRSHLARTLAQAEELGRISERFLRSGLPFVAFKGAALSAALYGDLSSREYTDIDILVSKDCLDEAERLLAELGYRGAQGDRAFRHAFLGYLNQFAFERGALDTAIDLHWSFFASHLPSLLLPTEVWPERVMVRIGRYDVPTLGERHRALLLAGHGTKESWRCLDWVADFAMVVDRDRALDWSDIHARASARGCGNAVLLGCALAEGLLDVAPPRALAATLVSNSKVQARASMLMTRLRGTTPLPHARANFADLDFWDRTRDRIGARLRLLFTRSTGDYAALPLPQTLWPLYYAVRPFRLMAKALTMAWR